MSDFMMPVYTKVTPYGEGKKLHGNEYTLGKATYADLIKPFTYNTVDTVDVPNGYCN